MGNRLYWTQWEVHLHRSSFQRGSCVNLFQQKQRYDQEAEGLGHTFISLWMYLDYNLPLQRRTAGYSPIHFKRKPVLPRVKYRHISWLDWLSLTGLRWCFPEISCDVVLEAKVTHGNFKKQGWKPWSSLWLGAFTTNNMTAALISLKEIQDSVASVLNAKLLL